MSSENGADVEVVDHSDEVKETTDTLTFATNSKYKRRKRSPVWDEFRPLSGTNFDDGRARAECIKCGQVYKADSSSNGTSSLRKHLLRYCAKQIKKNASQIILGANEGRLVMVRRVNAQGKVFSFGEKGSAVPSGVVGASVCSSD